MSYNLSVYLQFLFITLAAVGAIAIYNTKFAKPSLNQASGLNGWLYPMAFSVIFVLCYFYYTSYSLFKTAYVNDYSFKYFDASFAEYSQLLAVQIKTELAISVYFALSISYLVYSFITKKKLFAKLYVPLHFLVLLGLIGVQISWAYNPYLNHFNQIANLQIAIVALGALIWMPYTLKSKRVKATFIN